MSVDQDQDQDVHQLRVEYGRRLEQTAELVHAARRTFRHRAGLPPLPVWDGLSDNDRNEIRSALDELARADLEVVEDLTYLARRIRERD